MTDLINLVVPPGALGYPISFGTETYRPFMEDPADPASRWLVKVAPEAADGLTRVGGFRMLDTILKEIPAGFALVRHLTDPRASVGIGQPDGHGNFIVPIEKAAELAVHGFKLVEGQIAQPAMTEDESGKAVATAAARVLDLEQRLQTAGDFAAGLVGERDALKGKVADLEAKVSELLAKVEAAVGHPVEAVEHAVEGAVEKVEELVGEKPAA